MKTLCVIPGDGSGFRGLRDGRKDAVAAIRDAQKAGFVSGRRVLVGTVLGTIIGYNIALSGMYSAARFPLLVETHYGTVKCAAEELAFEQRGTGW